MNARKKTTERQLVLVRHTVAAKRKDITHLERLLKAPFPSEPGASGDGHSQDIFIPGFALGRCLVAARFANYSWVALYSNAASAEEIYKANAASRRLEVAWVGYRPDAGWFFRLNRAGKTVVDFAQALDDETPSACKLVGLKPNVLKKGESGEQAVKRLCQHFEISRPMPEVRISEEGFEVLDAAGRPMKSGLRGFLRIEGPAIYEGNAEAAAALEEAIDECDAEGIREAVEQGASLTAKLPDGGSTPLTAAIYKYDEPGWKECVELLLELGCPVNGPRNEPPLVEFCAHYIDDEVAQNAVELLVAHGANVNAVNREGETALFECVVNERTSLVRFLLQHGGDPHIKVRNGVSAVEWLRKRHDEEEGFRQRTKYAELLSMLTGQTVAKPAAPKLRPELQAENERFQRCRKLRRIVALLPKEFELKKLPVSPLARTSWHRDWEKELLDAGFKPAGHHEYLGTRLSAYTNPKRGFDALLSGSQDDPRCEVTAYHADHTATQVANYPAGIEPDLEPQSWDRKEFKGDRPAQLISHLQQLVQSKPVIALDASSFAARCAEALRGQSAEIRGRALHLLETPSILIDGIAPRYDRVGFYYDFSSWDDPAYSTEKHAQMWLDDFKNRNDNAPESLRQAITSAIHLAVMSHFQFAWSPDPRDFVVQASDLALAYFQACARSKGRGELAAWKIETLLRGLLLCTLAKRWQTFKKICDAVPPSLVSAKTSDFEDIDEYAPVLLLFVSGCRDQALPTVAPLEKAVEKRLARRPRCLLDVYRAVAAKREVDFEAALGRSLECFLEMQPQEQFIPTGELNDPFRYVALPESLFYLTALDRGMGGTPLPQHLADLLITPETIGRR
jgi:hypothetical protein